MARPQASAVAPTTSIAKNAQTVALSTHCGYLHQVQVNTCVYDLQQRELTITLLKENYTAC